MDQLKDQIKGGGDVANSRWKADGPTIDAARAKRDAAISDLREHRAEVLSGKNERQADKLDREADQQDKRMMKMSKKHGRGGRRAAKAAITAEGLRNAADRKRGL